MALVALLYGWRRLISFYGEEAASLPGQCDHRPMGVPSRHSVLSQHTPHHDFPVNPHTPTGPRDKHWPLSPTPGWTERGSPQEKLLPDR